MLGYLEVHYSYFHTSAISSDWIALQSGNLFSRYPRDGISGRSIQGMTAGGKFSKLL
jgi:hypothetical protein